MFECFKRMRNEGYDMRIDWATRVAKAPPEVQTAFRVYVEIITAEVSVLNDTGGTYFGSGSGGGGSQTKIDVAEAVERFLERHGL